MLPAICYSTADTTDHTLDVGLKTVALLSIGSTVFEDLDDNGLQEAGEAGISNVEIVIYQVVGNKDDAANGETDDILLDVGSDGDLTTATDGMPLVTNTNGDYFVTGLQPGDYYLVIPANNFADGEALADISISSTDISTSTGDNQRDGDDNGLQPAGPATEVCSPVITLSAGDEPEDGTEIDEEAGSGSTQDNASPLRDDNGDMTVDFGFFRPSVSAPRSSKTWTITPCKTLAKPASPTLRSSSIRSSVTKTMPPTVKLMTFCSMSAPTAIWPRPPMVCHSSRTPTATTSSPASSRATTTWLFPRATSPMAKR
jgi:hypothetical protein